MNIQNIAMKTGLSVRKLRYTLDHRLLPGARVKTDVERVGHPRSFTDLEGFGVACATSLLVCGVKRDAVIDFMVSICQYTWEQAKGKRRILTFVEAAFLGQREAIAILGDGLNVRFQVDERHTDWLQPVTFAQLKDYRPRGELQLDLGRIRDDLLR